MMSTQPAEPPQLPHEIILAIIEHIDTEEVLDDLRSLASVNRRFCEVLRPVLFRHVILDRYEVPDTKRKLRIETLSKPEIAVHIRELEVGIWAMTPKFFVDMIYHHKGRSWEDISRGVVPPIPECAFEPNDPKGRGRTRWSRNFEAALSQILAACCMNLRVSPNCAE